MKTYRLQHRRAKGRRVNYQKFRVKSPVRTFRDLEVYKQTTRLAAEIFRLKISGKDKNLKEELEILKNISKHIPKLVAESYGDRFTGHSQAMVKMEAVMRLISNAIAKIDFLIASIENQETKSTLVSFMRKYQRQRIKILNLKRAWKRIAEKYGRYDKK